MPKISRMMTGSSVAVAHKKAAWFHAAGLQLPGANYHGGLAEKVTATVPIVKGCGSLHEATLPAAVRHGTIQSVTALSKRQRGWRIKHPQAVTRHRKICNHSPIPGSLPGIYLYLGAWVGSQRKRPHCAVPLFRHCFAATRSALSYPDKESPHDLHLLRYPQSWPYRRASCYPYRFRLRHQ